MYTGCGLTARNYSPKFGINPWGGEQRQWAGKMKKRTRRNGPWLTILSNLFLTVIFFSQVLKKTGYITIKNYRTIVRELKWNKIQNVFTCHVLPENHFQKVKLYRVSHFPCINHRIHIFSNERDQYEAFLVFSTMTYTLHPRHMVIAKVISYGQVYLISTHLAYMFTRWLSSTFTSKLSFHNTTICEVVLCQCLAGVYCAVFRHNDLVNMVFKRYLWLWMSTHLSHPDILLWYVGKRCRSCHYSHTR